MKPSRKLALELLKRSTLDEYNRIIGQARLSRRQKFILEEKLGEHKRYNYQIAMELEVSPETIRDEIRDILDRVSNIGRGG